MDTLFPYVPLLIERYDFLVNELDTSEKRECLVRLPLYYSAHFACPVRVSCIAPYSNLLSRYSGAVCVHSEEPQSGAGERLVET